MAAAAVGWSLLFSIESGTGSAERIPFAPATMATNRAA
jgi:hypothetical protein